jgi:DNA-binding protein H-NS
VLSFRVARVAHLGAGAMREWNYRKIALNMHGPQRGEIELLNAAGAEGWELIGITSNNMAYLKRENEKIAPGAHRDEIRLHVRPTAYGAGERRAEVKVKYRDPATNDTWTGRGRMASWLKRKQEAGEDIEGYRV